MKKRILLRFVFAASFAAAFFPAFSKITFSDLDLGSDDRLLFSVQHEMPGTDSYKTLFCVQLDRQGIKGNPALLTCFPERMELLNGGKELQIRNRYGTARYFTNESALKWISLDSGIPDGYDRPVWQSASPDGRYLCYVRPTKNAQGHLVLADVKTQEEIVLDEKAAIGCTSVQAKWSPDSKVLLYEKNGGIFFVMPDAAFKKITLSEQHRKIGDGSIRSVQWTMQGSIMYISGDIVFCIDENELYTRSLYASVIGIGTIKGRLPFSFDSLRDAFWTNASGTNIAVMFRDSVLSVYSVSRTESCSYAKTDGFFPLTDFKNSSSGYEVFWSGSEPLLWINSIKFEDAEKISRLYSLKDGMNLLIEAKNSIAPVLSPDRKKIAFTDSEKLCIYDVSLKRTVLSKSGEKTVSAVWNGNSSVYAGGTETVKLVALTGEEKVLFLSSACSPAWDGGKIKSWLKNKKNVFSYDAEKNIWRNSLFLSDEDPLPSEKNAQYRVFLGNAANARFGNSIYVRSLSGKAKTYSVYDEAEAAGERPKRAALAFDAMENAEGLSKVLYALNEFGIKGTFFINGEFIRRHPEETALIASSGNECASLFFSTANLVENDFTVDSDFICRGLARNEDEFFAVTGKELSLLWHTPYYRSTNLIKNAGIQAGYTYVESFNKSSGMMSIEECQDSGKPYFDASSLIDLTVENLHDGIIISVDIGNSSGTRTDYLYEKLELLIAAILNSGYEIVSVRELSDK